MNHRGGESKPIQAQTQREGLFFLHRHTRTFEGSTQTIEKQFMQRS
jgi:hypothetical protein